MAERMTSRKMKALQMQKKIQKTALKLFDKHGFENVSVEDVAQAVGCSVGNIYHYFKSKDELALQMTDHVKRKYLELEKQYEADTVHTAQEKLLDFVAQTLRISSEEEALYKSFIHGLKYPEQGALKENSEQRVHFRMLRQMVADCQDEGSISRCYTVDEVVEQLVTMHRGILFEWRIYESNFDLAERGVRMAKILLRGWEKQNQSNPGC